MVRDSQVASLAPGSKLQLWMLIPPTPCPILPDSSKVPAGQRLHQLVDWGPLPQGLVPEHGPGQSNQQSHTYIPVFLSAMLPGRPSSLIQWPRKVKRGRRMKLDGLGTRLYSQYVAIVQQSISTDLICLQYWVNNNKQTTNNKCT